MEDFGMTEDGSRASSDTATVRLVAAGTPKAIAPEERWTRFSKIVGGVRRRARAKSQ